MPSLPSSLQDHTAYWLNRLATSVLAKFESQLSKHDVTVAQFHILISLYHGDAETPLELAKFRDVDSGTITRVVDRMIAKRLVKRRRNAKDRRSITLKLTDKGKALISSVIVIADVEDDAWLAPLNHKELMRLKKIFGKLLEHQGITFPDKWLKSGFILHQD